jgi:chorismate-pyruvate lyase
MNIPLRPLRPDLVSLFTLFPPADDIPDFEVIPAAEMPEPYHRLLVHEHHMTVTVEQFHGDLVDVHILARVHDGDTYARKIVLKLHGSGRLVQFGIFRMDLSQCETAVRAAITEGKTPLGRILIEHDVLRRIEPTAYLRLRGGPAQMAWFGLSEPATLYGRLAYIHCNGRRAIELLEIVAP